MYFTLFPAFYQSCSLFVSSNRLIPARVGGFSASIQVIVFSVSLKPRLKKMPCYCKKLGTVATDWTAGGSETKMTPAPPQTPATRLQNCPNSTPPADILSKSVTLSFALSLSLSLFQDIKLSADSYRIYSLYHSLHHYKYHTFLQCKKEVSKHVFSCFKMLLLFRAVAVLCHKHLKTLTLFFDCLILCYLLF